MRVVVGLIFALLLAIGGGVAIEAIIWKVPTGSVTGVFKVGGGPVRARGVEGTVYLYAVSSCGPTPACRPYTGQPLAVAHSNKEGQFSITAPTGTYDLVGRFSRALLPPSENDVTVIAGANVRADIYWGCGPRCR